MESDFGNSKSSNKFSWVLFLNNSVPTDEILQLLMISTILDSIFAKMGATLVTTQTIF